MKIKIYNLILGLLLILILVTPSVSAEESSASAITQEKIKEKIKESLEKVVAEGFKNIKGVISKKEQAKIYAYVGEIQSINNYRLAIMTDCGLKQVEVASQAAIFKIVSRKKTAIKFTQLEDHQFVIAMGQKDKEEVLKGTRIIITSKIKPSLERKVLVGKVAEIDNKKVTFQTDKEKETIIIGAKTKLRILDLEKPSVDDIQIGDQIKIIVSLDKNNKIGLVKTVLVVPGETNPAAAENEVEATTSASPFSEK